MDISTRGFAAELDADSTGRIITGTFVPFNSVETIYERGKVFDESFDPGSLRDSIAKRGDRVRLLGFHNDRSWPLGKATRLEERAMGGYFEARVSDTRDGNDALTLAKDGVLDGVSVGFSVPEGGDTWTAKGSRRTIQRAEIHEISLVNFPAYDRARVESVRAASRHVTPKPGLLTLEQAREYRYQGTFSEISDNVEDAIEAVLGVDDLTSDVCICDITDAWAVYMVVGMLAEQYEGYWKVPYSIDGSGVVTLDGDPQPVEQAWVPLEGEPSETDDGEMSDDMDRTSTELFSVRYRLELMRLELVNKRVA